MSLYSPTSHSRNTFQKTRQNCLLKTQMTKLDYIFSGPIKKKNLHCSWHTKLFTSIMSKEVGREKFQHLPQPEDSESCFAS